MHDITLDVGTGAFVSVVGPSGCGKSTLLNLAAGLITPSDGTVSVFGEPLQGLNRRAAYMFQQDALLPWETVLGNVMLGLRIRHVEARAAEARARDWIPNTRRPHGICADAFPSQLSGGMRKRVAVAQSWIVDPDILLMDEPFSALDVHRPGSVWKANCSICGPHHRPTVLFVTHDLEEAFALADEVVLLSAGPASRVVERYHVDLPPGPRNLIDIRTDQRFPARLYSQIWARLKDEVLRSYARRS